MKRSLRLAGLMLGASAGAIAQHATKASVAGVVSDPSGAVVARAKVMLTRPASKAAVTATTTSTDGGYTLPDLKPGVYDLRIEAPGFAAFTKSNLALKAGEQRSDAALQLASIEQAVDVGPKSTSDRPRGMWQKLMGFCKRPQP
ncbi:MAG: carboxypeptidase-like regulatory domain-containing protein [Bryobacteraceae bacterium]